MMKEIERNTPESPPRILSEAELAWLVDETLERCRNLSAGFLLFGIPGNAEEKHLLEEYQRAEEECNGQKVQVPSRGHGQGCLGGLRDDDPAFARLDHVAGRRERQDGSRVVEVEEADERR